MFGQNKKNKSRKGDAMRIALINVIALLCLLFPQILLAGKNSSEFTMTPRAQKIFDQAPKKPEELLKVIKEFMDHPTMDCYEFGERVSGIDRQYWGTGSKRQGFGKDRNLVYQQYYPRCPKCPFSPRAEVKKELPTAYSLGEFKMNVENNQLVDLDILFFTPTSEMPNMAFVVTPALFREFWGEPTKTYVSSPWQGGFSVGYYYLDYFYENSRYKLEISFQAPGDNNLELRRERMNHTREQMWAERKQRKKFANHKDFIAISLRITPSN